MGANKLRQKLPALIEAVRQAGQVRSRGGAGRVWRRGTVAMRPAAQSKGGRKWSSKACVGQAYGQLTPGPRSARALPTRPRGSSRCRWGPAMSRVHATGCRGLQVVTWVSDPMHGNTETVLGYKTRRYDNIRAEIEAFFDVHDQVRGLGSLAAQFFPPPPPPPPPLEDSVTDGTHRSTCTHRHSQRAGRWRRSAGSSVLRCALGCLAELLRQAAVSGARPSLCTPACGARRVRSWAACLAACTWR